MIRIPFSKKGGVFVPTFISVALFVNSGASGTFITLTPPSNERVKLRYLAADVATIIDMSIAVAGTDIVTSQTLAGPAGIGFKISNVGSPENTNSESGTMAQPIIGGVDEVITITITAGTTGERLRYSYEFGVLK